MRNIKQILFVLCLGGGFVYSSLLFSCANTKVITGGPKDSIPPKIVRIMPPNRTLHFKEKTISIDFDEYIALNKPNVNVKISPYLKRPLTFMRKKGRILEISLNSDLESNTTYTVLLDGAVKDVTEGNPLEVYEYVFSTGDKIDSLQMKGKVYLKPKESNKTYIVCLLTETATLKDLKYFSKTDLSEDGNEFSFRNLKKGKYKIVVFNDKNKNKMLNKDEAVDFFDDLDLQTNTLVIPKMLFPQINVPENLGVSTDKIEESNILQIEFNKKIEAEDSLKIKIDSLPIESLSRTYTFRVVHKDDFSVLNIYDKDFSFSNLKVLVETKPFSKTITFINQKKDLEPKSKLTPKKNGNIIFAGDTLLFEHNYPIKKLNLEKIKIVQGKDTLATSKVWIHQKDDFSIETYAPWKEGESYSISFDPDAITDWMDRIDTQTSTFKYSVPMERDLGEIILHFETENYSPTTLVILTEQRTNDVVKKAYLSDLEDKTLHVNYLYNGKYSLKILFDENKNGVWDSGSLEKDLRAEKYWYYENEIILKPNWQVEETVKVPLIK